MNSILFITSLALFPWRGFAIDCTPQLTHTIQIVESVEDRVEIGRRIASIFGAALGRAAHRNWNFRSQRPPTWEAMVSLIASEHWYTLEHVTDARRKHATTYPIFRVNRVTGEVQSGIWDYDPTPIPVSLRLDVGSDGHSFVLTLDWAEKASALVMTFDSPMRLASLRYWFGDRDESGKFREYDFKHLARKIPPTRFTLDDADNY